MTPERWKQVKGIFDQAVECDPASRLRIIREQCGHDEELKNEVEALLASDTPTGSLLDNLLVETNTGASPSFQGTLASLPRGDSFGPYVPLRVLGEGGMGTVYLAAQQQPIRREVALKVVKLGMDSRQVLERFEIERQALALMDYPNVARVLDAGTSEQGRPYFVMEYVDGVPITQYCDRKELGTHERLQLFIPVCNALQHAHKKGIIHRDVKPSNVLVTEIDGKPVPKVIDFGIARATDQQAMQREAFTLAGQLVGTPEYMSPEQASLGRLDIDTLTDVYSLGMVLYELLVGVPPLDLNTLRKMAFGEVLRVIRETPVPKPTVRITQMGEAAEGRSRQRGTDPNQLKRDLSGDLDCIVMKAIEKDRYCRYASALEFAADIERYLRSEPVLAGPPGAAYRMRKFVVRHKRPVAAAAAVVVALIAGIITTTWQARVAGQQRAVAIAEKAEAQGQRVLAEHQAAEAARQRDAAQAASARAIAAEGRARQERNAAIVEKRRADNEAAIATAVNDFLRNDLLAQASPNLQALPDNKPDPDLKVRTALDRAAARITGKFDTQPLVEASIRLTMGNTYRDLGQYPEAQRELERAADIRRRVLGETHLDTLASMSDLAAVYSIRRKSVQAEALHSRILEIRRHVLGPEHPDTLESMHGLAVSYYYQGKYGQAEALLKQTLDIRQRVQGPEHPETLGSMADLATNYSFQGKYAQAEALHTQTLEIRRRVLGPEHPNTLMNTTNLADDYMRQGKYAQAEALQMQALEIRRRVLGPEHPDTLRSMGGLALLYSVEGKYALADALHIQTLEIRRRTLGSEHIDTQNSVLNLARSYVAQGKYAQAETLYVEALDVRSRVQGPEHPDTLTAMNNLGVVYFRQGKDAPAEPLLVKALEVRRRVLGEEHTHTLYAMNSLGQLYLHQVKYAQAEPLLIKALEVRRRVLGPDDPDTTSSKATLAGMWLLQRKYAETEPLIREALNDYEKLPDGWERYLVQSMLGGSLVGQKKYADAEPLLLSGYQGIIERVATVPGNALSEVERAGDRILQLYQDWGKPEKAAEWRLKLDARNTAHEL
jgi:non-specific serine/threonine protein kinase/serine/threonine-protein kinase